MNEEFENGMMIESKDKIVTIDSMVCISPFNIETGEWTTGLMIITSMQDALERKCKKVTKDKNVEKFMEEYFRK